MRQHRHRQAIGGTDLVRHVEADALRIALFHVGGECGGRRDDVVGAGLVQHVAARPERGALDAIAAAIREHVIADPGDVAAVEIIPERVVVVFFHRDDPHVDAVRPHRARQHLLELVETNLTLDLPAAAGLLGGGRRRDKNDQREGYECFHHRAATAGKFTIRYTTSPVFGDDNRLSMYTRFISCLTMAAVLVPVLTFAQAQGSENGGGSINYDTARTERRLAATQAQGRIELDGRLDEPSWGLAPLANNFVQNDPREGEPATYDTEVRMVYDDRALYIGVFAKDPEPGQIIVNELRKDFNTGTADGFQIVIDTFQDERNGYQFAINPGGAKWDSQMSNEGRDQNQNWDGIWDVGTRIGEDGWYAEIEIPFKTLKFGPADLQNWGINFQRRLRRRNENSYWSPLRRIHSLSRVSMAGTYEGLQGLTPGANVRVKPYALANLNKLAGVSLDKDFDAGFDVKYGVTSGLTWDFTVNTDFSQAEADEQQINLSRFNLFFPEKRDFFLENSGIFLFGAGGGGFAAGGGGGGGGGRQNGSGDTRLFFSRRIGLSDTGNEIPILAGTRLTGRQGAYSIGVLNIQQRSRDAVPAANFTALRVRRDLLANSDIGAVFLNKEAGGPAFNRVAGVDANFRFGPSVSFNAYGAKTFSPAAAVPAEGRDHTMRVGGRYDGRIWQVNGRFDTIGARFNDEMG